jgi:hypothetical protein
MTTIFNILFGYRNQLQLINKFSPTASDATEQFKKMVPLLNHPSLAAALSQKFTAITEPQLETFVDELLSNELCNKNLFDTLHKIGGVATQRLLDPLESSPNKKWLETLYKIITLSQLKTIYDTQNPSEVAQVDARSLKLPTTGLETLRTPAVNFLYIRAPALYRFFAYAVCSPETILSSTINQAWASLYSAGPIFNLGPQFSISGKDAAINYQKLLVHTQIFALFKGLWNFCREITDWYTEKFSYPKRALLATLLLWSVSYFFVRVVFKFSPTYEAFDTEGIFENLCYPVRAGLISPGRDRIKEKELLSIHLCSDNAHDVPIVFITGPTGAGKTQFVNNFA